MQFLVTGEWVEHGALLPPDQAAQLLETAVLPSLQTLARWEEEGRLQGGILAGQRAGAYLLEAASGQSPLLGNGEVARPTVAVDAIGDPARPGSGPADPRAPRTVVTEP